MSNVVPFQRPPKPPPPVPPAGDWRDRIDYKQSRRGTNEILHTLANATTILRNDPAWRGVLAWDELSQGIVARARPPWYTDPRCIDDADGEYDPTRPWDDCDGWRVQNWLQRKWALSISAESAYRAALLVARANRFDPLTDWLTGLQHDGLPRVDRWLHTYLGAEDTDYTRLVGRLFLVGSVQRALRPGSKFDTMLVAEGAQDVGKSTAFRRLYGDEYFRETPIDLHSNDRFLALRGCWCREWPELDGLSKADTNRVKSYISPTHDDYRAPYARNMVHVPRRVVLVATVNPPQLGYLVDESGNRRMWPVVCGVAGPIVHDSITADRNQIWAEAVAMWRAGAKCYPATPDERRLCNQEQQARMVAEVWQGKIAQWLNEGTRITPGAEVTIRQILTECLMVPLERCDRGNSTRVGACLSRLGWRVGGREATGDRERFYVRKTEDAKPSADDDERAAIQGEPAA